MDLNSPFPCPNTVTVRRNPPRRARPTPSSNPPQDIFPPPVSSKSNKTDVTPFPTQEILSMEIPQPDPTSSTQIEPPVSENLKVYLRIRPLLPVKSTKEAVDQNCRRRNKNAWPQNPTAKQNTAKSKAVKKKNGEVCVSINDSQSVTLSPPLALQESKRIKSVVYDGFSHVFAPDISQSGVYEKMVKPLVEDFLNGKSGMIAALGPSGSGKTHTVFGTVREPGMVPLALQHIFKQTPVNVLKQSRSFYISIFEISSEGGKAEKLFDLSPDGADLSMQQSVIKGLQEVPVANAEQAESLIASALLKRATAMTNTNSQSSRSQCIINIHSLVNQSSTELDVQPNNAILTIVDLAGAERERRTGNQGSRLLESNFINNTSMVFGLCLRSLLEHQKNPKKPLQKHFQNSLLTRYLRGYLEGKKRMALILTIKPGEEDYLDTSYLLRQASPYMKIKFSNVEEQSTNSVNHKRRIHSCSIVEEPKRKKYCDLDAHMIEEGKSSGEEDSQLEEGCTTVADAPKITKLNTAAIPSVKSDRTAFKRERDHQIMQNFAKAIWNVLKEYKDKLRVAEKEIESLNENLGHEKTRYIQLEKEHEVFKSFCTCSKETLVEATFLKVDNDFDIPVYMDGNECNNAHEMTSVKEFNCDNSPTTCNLKPQDDHELFSEVDVNIHSKNHEESQSKYTPGGYAYKDVTNQMNATVIYPHIREYKSASSLGNAQADVNTDFLYHECASTPRGNQDPTSEMDVAAVPPEIEESKLSFSPGCARVFSSPLNAAKNSHSPYEEAFKCASTPGNDQDATNEADVHNRSHSHKASQIKCSPRGYEDVTNQADVNNRSHNHKASQTKRSTRGYEDVTNQMDETVRSPDIEESKGGSSPGCAQNFSSPFDENSHSPTHKASKHTSTNKGLQHVIKQMDATLLSSNLKASKCSNPTRQDQDVLCEINRKPLDSDLPPLHNEDAAVIEKHNLSKPDCEIRSEASGKLLNLKKPKRRLMPASSILLRDIAVLGIEDEPEKPKGNRGGNKLVADERTQGSISLVRLLQSNLRL